LTKDKFETPKKKEKKGPKYALPNARLSIDSQIEILKAYVVASDKGKNPVSYKDVGKIAQNHPVEVSRCNKFFIEIGFLEKVDKKYLPSKCTIDFYNCELSKSDESKTLLKELIEKSWFGQYTKKLLEYRKKINGEELISSIEVEVEATEKDRPALRQVVEYMEFVKFIRKIPETNNYELEEENVILPQEKENEIRKIESITAVKREIKEHFEYKIDFSITITPETTKEDMEKMVKLVRDYIDGQKK
jgi:hypothetical protein